MMIEIVGIVGGMFTTFCFLPQALRVIKTNDTESLSMYYTIMLVIGIVLWIIYGWNKRDIVIVMANCVTFILAFTIMFYKVKNVILKKEAI